MSMLVAGVLSYYASSEPDGLERVAADLGFLDTATEPLNGSVPTADYGIEGIDNERLSGGIAGVLGVLVVLVVAFGLFWFLGRRSRTSIEV